MPPELKMAVLPLPKPEARAARRSNVFRAGVILTNARELLEPLHTIAEPPSTDAGRLMGAVTMLVEAQIDRALAELGVQQDPDDEERLEVATGDIAAAKQTLLSTAEIFPGLHALAERLPAGEEDVPTHAIGLLHNIFNQAIRALDR